MKALSLRILIPTIYLKVLRQELGHVRVGKWLAAGKKLGDYMMIKNVKESSVSQRFAEQDFIEVGSRKGLFNLLNSTPCSVVRIQITVKSEQMKTCSKGEFMNSLGNWLLQGVGVLGRVFQHSVWIYIPVTFTLCPDF